MSWNHSVYFPSALIRCRDEDRKLFSSRDIQHEIDESLRQSRGFPFYPDLNSIKAFQPGEDPKDSASLLIPLRDQILAAAAENEPSGKRRVVSQGRLADRLLDGLILVHRALGDIDKTLLSGRRFVFIRERPASPTIFHISSDTSLLCWVDAGPPEKEQPTIYLGFNLTDSVSADLSEGLDDTYNMFLTLLRIEERAIETGYSHTDPFTREQESELNQLLDRVISRAGVFYSPATPIAGKSRPFSPRQRESLLEQLDARLPGESGLFNYDQCRAALDELEKLARRFKTHDDRASLREVVRLLVAASGHDIHEIRNRANILLERVFAPKEFDAPLATSFITLDAGTSHTFSFDLPSSRTGYFLRIYGDRSAEKLFVHGDLDYTDIILQYSPENGKWEASRIFRTLGSYDWVVYRKLKNGSRWVDGSGGRLNVQPGLDGELVLEIFPDIHGHTRLYWGSENPGMVFNESGQIIRTGTFYDIKAHLEDIKSRYSISALYVLGIQKRGSNREDWAAEARSPSPFAPMSLTALEPALGGEEGFLALVKEAHRLDIKIVVDVIPHINRRSDELPEEMAVRCYDSQGNLIVRASTDGRYGSWNDGKLLNYRKFAVWEWLADSVCTLIEKFDIDGIRFDSSHAVPVMMRRNNYPFLHGDYRSRESLVEGEIIDNNREYDHYVTTGYYDSACAELIAVPFHYYLYQRIHRLLLRLGKKYFVNLAECYWGREQYLSRTGTVPYNSALFKICENIIHGKTDVREIYHIYQHHYPSILPPGAELLGILGNHDERRALNTFGARGFKAAVMLTSFLSRIILDYEGSAEGESWKVYLDNIYVNWNDFEREANRGTQGFYSGLYGSHRQQKGRAHLIWANNTMVAAAVRFSGSRGVIGAFNFADRDERAFLQFDDPALPVDDDAFYQIIDPVYSTVTGLAGWYSGRELRESRIEAIIPHTDRYKLLNLVAETDEDKKAAAYPEVLKQSTFRLCSGSGAVYFKANFAFRELKARCGSYRKFREFLVKTLLPLLEGYRDTVHLALKRFMYNLYRLEAKQPAAESVWYLINSLLEDKDASLKALGDSLKTAFRGGSLIFLAAEADPFSKSGGLANVVYELPRELASLGEETVVITPFYKQGDDKVRKKMDESIRRYNIRYTGRTVRFYIQSREYEIGVHHGMVDGIHYYLLDHHEFFDGLYFGITGDERLRRRTAFARAAAEVIRTFELDPLAVFTNDAFTGVFCSIVRSDPGYAGQSPFDRASLVHIVHNGGWQYFDAYHRFEKGTDLFRMFNLGDHEYWRFEDPSDSGRINCMASGIRSADRIVTVSPSYADQIRIGSDGMERILHDVTGINNGVGIDFRLRALEKMQEDNFIQRNLKSFKAAVAKDLLLKEQLEEKYPELIQPESVDTMRAGRRRQILERMRIKLLVQLSRGLQVDPDAPLCVMIHRLTEQKGFQLLLEASHGIFSTLGYQGIIGGAVAGGDDRGDELARGLLRLADFFPRQVSVGIGYQDVRIPLLGADIFLMPSMHEPGGISQLEAFACGAFVCARATGGLKDTVVSLVRSGRTLQGNGVLFSDYSAPALYDAMQRFHRIFTEETPEKLSAARETMIRNVYSWREPAEKYRELVYSTREIIPGTNNS